MWFIADVFERYTTRVAKTFFRLTMMEVEGSRRAWANAYARPEGGGFRLPDPQAKPRTPPVEGPADGAPEAAAASPAARGAVSEPCAVKVPSAIRAFTRSKLPMGVRGEVVARYIQAFCSAGPGEAADLVERLRKDKKVRVAELQIIVADLLEEEPTLRKKGDHLAALRRHFVVPTDRPQARLHFQPQLHGG